MRPTMDLHRISVKFFAATSGEIKLPEFIPIFHRWIQTAAVDGLLIDVANYAHVPEGPGIMLIAHEGHYAMDVSGGRMGLMYCRKRPLAGDLSERLTEVLRIALRACRQLEQTPELAGRIRFPGDELRIVAHDRLVAPNMAETATGFEAALSPVLAKLFDGTKWTVTREADACELLSLAVKASAPPGTDALLERLL